MAASFYAARSGATFTASLYILEEPEQITPAPLGHALPVLTIKGQCDKSRSRMAPPRPLCGRWRWAPSTAWSSRHSLLGAVVPGFAPQAPPRCTWRLLQKPSAIALARAIPVEVAWPPRAALGAFRAICICHAIVQAGHRDAGAPNAFGRCWTKGWGRVWRCRRGWQRRWCRALWCGSPLAPNLWARTLTSNALLSAPCRVCRQIAPLSTIANGLATP